MDEFEEKLMKKNVLHKTLGRLGKLTIFLDP